MGTDRSLCLLKEKYVTSPINLPLIISSLCVDSPLFNELVFDHAFLQCTSKDRENFCMYVTCGSIEKLDLTLSGFTSGG